MLTNCITVLRMIMSQFNDLTKQERLANAKVKARHHCVCEGPKRRNLRQINSRNIMLKSTFSRLHRRRWHNTGSSFSTVVGSLICEIPRNPSLL